jgi:LCP family protein required for cell wall assembly
MAPDDEDERPDYRVYRSKPRLFDRGGDTLGEPREDGAQPEYEVQRSGRRLPRLPFRRRGGGGRRITPGRVVKWLLLAVVGWIALSLVLFMVSATIQRKNTSDAARDALTSAGYPLTTPNTILVLGSDARQPGTKEPGADVGGPSRSDSILLIRTGGGTAARLSIPRDTVVDIPGHGRNKINAAYAIGGPALAIETVEQFLGLDVNHLVEVNFGNFPEFIDALGGIDVSTGCVKSDINGGTKNGGYSLRLRGGENHLSGKQALALARTRKNDCNPSENDLTRARRQQKILASIKSRLVSPAAFFRLPWIGWEAPKAIRSDMGGPTLLGVFGAIQTGGDAKDTVLTPTGAETLPDGGAGLDVDQAEVDRAREAFLKG